MDNRAGVTGDDLDKITALVAGQVTLEDVTRWALSQTPPRVFSRSRGAAEKGAWEAKGPGFDVYVQDEFTHDVVIPYDVEGRLCLVYDTT